MMPRTAIDVDLGPFANVPSSFFPQRYVPLGEALGGFYGNGRYDRYGVYGLSDEHVYVQWHATVLPEGGELVLPDEVVRLDSQPYMWTRLGLFRQVSFFVDDLYGMFLPEVAESYLRFLTEMSPVQVADLGLEPEEL